jgi:predicted NUDIX family NTP pyrophosphohydrolase
MATRSAGILMYQRTAGGLAVLLVHPGGPFWRRRDDGAWSIPKGEYAPDESAEAAARREFAEELGIVPVGALEPLGEIRQRGGKCVDAFALAGGLDLDAVRSNTFAIEWPPKSGRIERFPEIDRAAWLDLSTARRKILASQAPLLQRLERMLEGGAGWGDPGR